MASVEDIISRSEEYADDFEQWSGKVKYVAIVGSVDINLSQKHVACHLIRMIYQWYMDRDDDFILVSGGAEGIDSLAEEIAKTWGIPTEIFRPEKKGWEWYKKRNELVAQRCDVLYRIYTEQSKTYGSGWTRDRATELGKETYPICLPVR